jgi:hypothetical protein
MEDLAAVCQHNYMISALLHLFTSQEESNMDTPNQEAQSRHNCL